MNEPAPPSGRTPGFGLGERRPGLAPRRVLAVAFGVSAVLHLAVILVYPSLMHRDVVDPTPFLVPFDAEPAEGMDVILVFELAPEEPEEPEEPELPEDILGPEVRVAAPSVEGPQGPVLTRPGPTAAERLRPDLRDERVWAPVPEERVELSLQQRLDLDLAARIVAYRDSVAQAIARADGATDWTYTDKEGKKWGISPGALHLGDVTIPLPFNFGARNPLAQREVMRIWDEMQRQATRAMMQDSWKERAQAIRARRDRERARADTIG